MTDIVFFGALTLAMLVLGFAAARWRRPQRPHSLEEWGVGGRAFGNWVTWFLLGGSMYTAYTFVAVPAATYGVGAVGFFAIPFAIITTPMMYFISTRVWSVSHVHGFVTPAEFTRARFGSRGLAALVAVTGIAATMPYIAVQLVALQAMLTSIGLAGEWPMLLAVAAVSLCTFRSGLRAPALLSIAKDVLLVWLVLSMAMVVAWSGGWDVAFQRAERRFSADSSPVSGLLLPAGGQLGYFTLIIGSALAIFAYPHAVTGILAAKDRATVKRNAAAMPIYCLALGFMALLGIFAIGQGVRPLGSDLNTVVPQLFETTLPPWSAGIAYAAIGVAALIPAAVMSIAAANLFTRSIYREYMRRNASDAEEAAVSRYVSLLVKFGAVACIVFFDQQFSIELQLIGGVVVLQTVPAVVAGLWTNWPHRFALMGGLLSGLTAGMLMLYQIPQRAADGRIVKAHFGGSSWPVADAGSVYVGLIALAVNLAVVVIATLALRAMRVPAGVDLTRPQDYLADRVDDSSYSQLDALVDGLPRTKVGAHAKGGGY